MAAFICPISGCLRAPRWCQMSRPCREMAESGCHLSEDRVDSRQSRDACLTGDRDCYAMSAPMIRWGTIAVQYLDNKELYLLSFQTCRSRHEALPANPARHEDGEHGMEKTWRDIGVYSVCHIIFRMPDQNSGWETIAVWRRACVDPAGLARPGNCRILSGFWPFPWIILNIMREVAACAREDRIP